MNQQEILNKLSGFKSNLQTIWEKISEHEFERTRERIESSKKRVKHLLHSSKLDEEEANDYPAEVDDLPLTLNRESRPGIKFYSTENASIAIGATKEPAEGIDSFGEDSSYDVEDERRQNSDLSKRFYTGGMDLDELNKH